MNVFQAEQSIHNESYLSAWKVSIRMNDDRITCPRTDEPFLLEGLNNGTEILQIRKKSKRDHNPSSHVSPVFLQRRVMFVIRYDFRDRHFSRLSGSLFFIADRNSMDDN